MALSRLVWIKGMSKALAAILLFTLFYHPVSAQGSTNLGTSAVVLHWEPSPSPGIIGYRIYYGTASGQYVTSVEVGSVVTATITDLTVGISYYFAVTAFNADGDESDFSNEYKFVPGLNVVQLRVANGHCVLTVMGLAGQTYEILATQDFSAWTVIGTVVLDAGGSLDFTDPDAANFSQRFYRTRLHP